MSENTKLWDILGRTDPKHTKPFKRSGGFKGTAIKPMWSYRRMTEEFGMCGVGWGVNEPVFQVVNGDNSEVLVYCTASIWHEDRSNVVYGVGGDKIVAYIKANEQYNTPERWQNDDEAFKKAYTDAITNALKMIGVGADVHMGMFDDNKYVNTMQAEFAETAESVITNSMNPKPKRVAGVNPKTGERTAYSIREKEEMQLMRELAECKTVPMLTKLAFEWSIKVEQEKWPDAWKAWARGLMNQRKTEILNTPALDDDEFPEDPDPLTSPENILTGG